WPRAMQKTIQVPCLEPASHHHDLGFPDADREVVPKCAVWVMFSVKTSLGGQGGRSQCLEESWLCPGSLPAAGAAGAWGGRAQATQARIMRPRVAGLFQ